MPEYADFHIRFKDEPPALSRIYASLAARLDGQMFNYDNGWAESVEIKLTDTDIVMTGQYTSESMAGWFVGFCDQHSAVGQYVAESASDNFFHKLIFVVDSLFFETNKSYISKEAIEHHGIDEMFDRFDSVDRDTIDAVLAEFVKAGVRQDIAKARLDWDTVMAA